MLRAGLIIALTGCGRIDFGGLDALGDTALPDDAALPSFGADCVVGLRFDEPAWTGAPGEVIDACGGDDPGTSAGVARIIDDPVRGRVGEFGGLTDCVAIADAPALRLTTAATLSAWVYPTGIDGVSPHGVIAKRTSDDVAVAYTMFVWTGGRVHVDINTEDDEFESITALANGQWHQITTVFEGAAPPNGRSRIYIDGALDQVASESANAIMAFTSDLHVGCLPQLPMGTTQQSFPGRIDDVAVWSRALTPAEVEAWFEATRR